MAMEWVRTARAIVGYEDRLADLQGRQEGKHTVLPFSLSNIDLLPSVDGGVYAIWCKPTGKCIYVGHTARNLRQRLVEHWGLQTNKTLARWITVFGDYLILCYHRCNESQAKRIESRLIKTWQPEANKDLK